MYDLLYWKTTSLGAKNYPFIYNDQIIPIDACLTITSHSPQEKL